MNITQGSMTPIALGPFISVLPPYAPITSGTPTVVLYVDGVLQAATGQVSPVDANGMSEYITSPADTATLGSLKIVATLPGAIVYPEKDEVVPAATSIPVPAVAAPSALEPVTLSEAKTYARVTETADDELICGLIVAARQHVESKLRRQLMPAILVYSLDQFPIARITEESPLKPWMDLPGRRTVYQRTNGIRLPHPPLQSVTQIQYIDFNGVTQVLDPSVYLVDTIKEPGVVMLAYNNLWPICRAQPQAVLVTYVAGYPSRAAVPQAIKLAIKMIVRHWYDYRGTHDEVSLAPIGETLDAILSGQSYGSYFE